MELKRGKKDVERNEESPNSIPAGLETGCRPSARECSRDTECFILSPGLRQGVGRGDSTPRSLQLRRSIRGAFSGLSRSLQEFWGHGCIGGLLAVEAELLQQRIDLLTGHVAEWDSLMGKREG